MYSDKNTNTNNALSTLDSLLLFAVYHILMNVCSHAILRYHSIAPPSSILHIFVFKQIFGWRAQRYGCKKQMRRKYMWIKTIFF